MDWRTRTDIEKHIVVLGGGFAGVYTARYLAEKLKGEKGIHLTLVNDENYFVFQPLLPEVAAGTLEATHLVNPIRHLLPDVDFDCARVERIDLDRQEIHFRPWDGSLPRPLPFHELVLALGMESNLAIIPGMAEHALPMKNLGDAFHLRHHVIRKIECAANEPDPVRRAEMLTLVVVGGGFSGVETAAELHDAMEASIQHYPEISRTEPRIVIVQSGDRILPELSPQLSEKATQILTRRGMQVLTHQKVVAVSPTSVQLGDGTRITTETVVCTIGTKPHALLKDMGLPLDRGRVVVEPTLQVKGIPHVWAVGDMALVPNADDGKPAPPTAQFAIREGRVCAENLVASLKGGTLTPFKHRSQGQFASLGHHQAVAEIPVPGLGKSLRFSGFPAWWMWRTLYLLKLPTLSRKVRVALDWTLDLFFHRELVGLNVFRSQRVSRSHYEAGQAIVSRGQVGRTFYLLRRGEAELRRPRADGQDTVLRLGPGDHFGEDTLLNGTLCASTVVALTACDLVTVGHEDFLEMTTVLDGMRGALEEVRRSRSTLSVPINREDETLQVTQVMTHSPRTLTPHCTLDQLVESFKTQRVSGFPIVDDDGSLLGMVTRTDLYRALENNLPPETPLSAFMTTSLVTISPDASLPEAADLLRRRHVKRLLVLEKGALVGVLTPTDIFRARTQLADVN